MPPKAHLIPTHTVSPVRCAKPAIPWPCYRMQHTASQWCRLPHCRIHRQPSLPAPLSRWVKSHPFPDLRAQAGPVLALARAVSPLVPAFTRSTAPTTTPVIARLFSIASLECQEIFVNHRHLLQPLGRHSLLAFALWATTAAHAQTAPESPSPQKKNPTVQAAPAKFQSALENYRPYTDQKTGNWKEANDLTARIGGWRAYAKEAAQSEPDPHAGHAKPPQVQPTQAKP